MNNIGLIGLAVMGQNLARNIANKGYKISVYNRTTSVMEEFIAEHGSENLEGHAELEDFVNSLETPRKIILLVKAGGAVDAVIEGLKPLLDKDDIIIDGGNSLYTDTQRRYKKLKEEGFNFIGSGVSGGEEGALNGPSLMPGGDKDQWELIKPIWEDISARDFNGGPCTTYVGEDGAGHYVKMVHNGIEYGVMQIMAEGYEMLKTLYGLSADEIGEIFAKYNEGKLKSFLFEISVPVLTKKEDGINLIDVILDKAGQKGTGRWTVIDALQRGVNLGTIEMSVEARVVSSHKERRTNLEPNFSKPEAKPSMSLEEFIPVLEDAMYTSMLCSYAQGYDLIKTAAVEEGWNIDLAEVTRIWEGGCIIRAEILNFLHRAFENTTFDHMFEVKEVHEALETSVPKLRKVAAEALLNGVPAHSMAASLTYFDAMTQGRTSANMIQGLRDNFGAHTYERIDKEGSFHTEWNQ